MKEYLREYSLDMVVIVETRVSGTIVNSVISALGMSKSHRVKARGFSGGFWILWKDDVKVQVLVNSGQYVHLKVKFRAFTD